MSVTRGVPALLAAAVLLAASPALADEPVCSPVSKVPLERHLRQLTLDLLGRPPTYEEYQAARARGQVTVDDVRALMQKEEFYGRIRAYHRALLWSNVSASIIGNGNLRLLGTGSAEDPLALRGPSSRPLRGDYGQGCDSFIAQDDCGAARQDPHADPALPTTAEACAQERYDERGVPLPVSWDYDTNYYTCTRLDQTPTDATITSCEVAVARGRIPARYLFFCDMRRQSNGTRVPYLCLPDPGKATTAALTQEVLAPDGSGRVVAFAHPSPTPSTSLARLDRCTLNLGLKLTSTGVAIKGAYEPQRGCVQREGYVTQPAPFWSAERSEVRVCAIEAQARTANPWTLEPCITTRFIGDRTCGCGEGLRRCDSPDGFTHQARLAAINTEPELIADSVVRRDEPYFNILTTRRSFLNGPLSELYRAPQQGVGVFSVTPPAEPQVLPVVPFAQTDTWKEYVRGPQHSGVLTTASYLYRFPTQRSRVNHFYSAFLCRSFVPPANARPPPPEDSCNRENNLAKRCGCNACHATIEPTGAHWGRFAERTALFLDPDHFPRYDPRCRDCALANNLFCGGECGQYVMQASDGDGASSLGMLKTYLYRSADEEQSIDGGPRLLVQRMLQTGELERCTVQRVWQEFLGRPMSAEEQRLYLQPLADGFARDGYRFKALIERVVMTDAYRRID
ncbi:DUF1585 domain-containing protein [Vitiosangium sp. GDMCC 1.1324]|uniref:DUF1585 domain-containing protein n=1 Tax=Vitiosangium sp. (strain GDMCC 1.1324) TaxID=2138576 RepID=UPI000D35A70B|nr:DUF1585 domain-containing protein [Vitiosangium sp. GDMCC 1.1324]PTL77187.1 DUF1585 domain-containing protein [Vitiosangium sp. GDMCC 1.1324]